MNSFFFAQNHQGSNESLGYGYLYNSYAARDIHDSLELNTDWKIPTQSDFNLLASVLDGYTSGQVMKESGYDHWSTSNTGTNTSGFTMLGSGERDTTFSKLTFQGYLFLSTFTLGYSNLFVQFNHDNDNSSIATLGAGYEYVGRAIRLLYTGTGTPTSMTDYDGNVYDVVLIGTQYWTVQNWKCTHLNDGTALTKVTDATAWAALTTEGYCAYDNDESNV